MNRIIVVSDSHGLVQPLEAIYERYKDTVQAFIHCGDSELPMGHPLLEVYRTVKGNVDSEPFPMTLTVDIGGRKILVTHGHKQGVRFGLGRIREFGLANNADLVCFGHTHKPYFRDHDGVWLLNPGSIRVNRGFRRIPESFALIEWDNDLKVTFIDVKTFESLDIG